MSKKELERRQRLFVVLVRKYAEMFNAKHWKIDAHEATDIFVDDSERASFRLIHSARLLTITWQPAWIRRPSLTDEEIREVAFHEVFEAGVLGDIMVDMEDYYSKRHVDLLMHSVLMTVYNAMKEHL